MPYRTLFFCHLFFFLINIAAADEHLLYFEAQDVFGYSSALGKTITYSRHPDAEMQKPSLGFDYLQRFSDDSGDYATFALQARIAATRVEQSLYYKSVPQISGVEADGFKPELQIYNAYLKVKTPLAYVWIGHNRPALGLSSTLDSHGLLLTPLGMRFGYDRDWGVGLNRDFSWGDISASSTSGSGMPVYKSLPDMPFDSHYLNAARVSYGVLRRDNYNLGFSGSRGRTLETIGYTLMDTKPRSMHLAGADLTVMRDNFEHRFEAVAGEWLGSDVHAYFYRFGVVLDEEGKYKIEAQPTYWTYAVKDTYWTYGKERDYQMALCLTVLASSSFTVRTMHVYDHVTNDNWFLLQLYYYGLI